MRFCPGWLPIAVLLTAGIVRAGTITTTSGESLSGELKRGENGWSITLDDGQVRWVSDRELKSIELNSNTPRPGKAAEGLRSLRRSVEFSDDLPRIIQRYQTFIEQSKDPTIVTAAKADLAVWQTRLDQHLVKVGKNWITAGQRDLLVRKWRQSAEQARLLIKDDRDREAAQLISQVLEEDPQNASANYLRGVLADKKKDWPEAKKAYQDVQQQLPQHAPTLFNLALVLSHQKQWPASFVAMEQALSAAPVTQVLLDSAAEYLSIAPQDLRRIPAAQKLLKTFLDQDARLQKMMATRKLYRWGSTWINQDDHDRLKKQSDDVQQQINDIDKEFKAAQQRLVAIDQRVKDNENAMRDMQQQSVYRMPDGSLVRVPLPRQYYTMQSENVELKAERKDVEAKIEPLRASAREAQQKLPQPVYTGVILPVNEDGVPLADVPPDPNATTAPATEPATQPTTIIRIGPAN